MNISERSKESVEEKMIKRAQNIERQGFPPKIQIIISCVIKMLLAFILWIQKKYKVIKKNKLEQALQVYRSHRSEILCKRHFIINHTSWILDVRLLCILLLLSDMEKIYKGQLVRMGNLPASLPNATPLALPSRIQSNCFWSWRHSKGFIEKRIKPPEFNKKSTIFG
jgi:hypothetical protein